MPIFREQTDLDKKPTWYLFLGANVIVLLGCVITFVLFVRNTENLGIIYYVPSIVCNIVALIIAGIFLWLEAKSIMPKAVHFRKKWLYWYLSAMIVFVVSIIFNFVFLISFLNSGWKPTSPTWPLIIYMVITGVLTLVAIGLQRYSRFKIDLDIYRRKHGALPKQEEIDKQKAKVENQDEKGKISPDQPTSGLMDSIEKQ